MNVYEQSVHESLDNAVENGHDLMLLSSHDIAVDLATCDADCEGTPVEFLERFVRSWKKRKLNS